VAPGLQGSAALLAARGCRWLCGRLPRRPGELSRFQRHPCLTFVGILVLTLVALVAFRLVSSGAKKDPRKERVISVGTIVPVRKDLNVRLVYTADIQPYQQVNIFSRVDGYIAKIYV